MSLKCRACSPVKDVIKLSQHAVLSKMALNCHKTQLSWMALHCRKMSWQKIACSLDILCCIHMDGIKLVTCIVAKNVIVLLYLERHLGTNTVSCSACGFRSWPCSLVTYCGHSWPCLSPTVVIVGLGSLFTCCGHSWPCNLLSPTVVIVGLVVLSPTVVIVFALQSCHLLQC